MFLYSSFVIFIHLMFDLCLWPYQLFFLKLFSSSSYLFRISLYCIIGAARFQRWIVTCVKCICILYALQQANIVCKQLQILDIRYETNIYLVWGTKKGGIHSWENGDLDEDGVSFLSLSLSLSLHYTSFWLIPVLYMYIVEDGLSDKLTKRLALKINKKGEKK